jgi:hypothetical protein
MAITRKQLERLQKENKRLKTANAKLRRELRERESPRKNGERGAEKPVVSQMVRAREVLRKAGALVEPSPEDKRIAAEWRALPMAEREAALQRLQSVRLNPPISETVIRDRD